MKEIVSKLIASELRKSESEISKLIEIPPVQDMGDFAFPCFGLANEFKKNPLEISKELTEKLRRKLPKEVEKIETKGAYVNFFVDKKVLIESIFEKVFGVHFGKENPENKKIGIEYPSPNTNKALHVGHLRNISIGNSISRIISNFGNRVFHLNLFNDRGILISKSMVGYQMFADNKNPSTEKVKGDRYVGGLYVKFSKASKENPELEKKAAECLKKWEEGEKETLKLWKKLNSWSYDGMQKTFDEFGLFPIDKNYYESEIYKEGKSIIKDGLDKKIFSVKEDGAIYINLENENLGEKILLRSDGTSVYMTQDLYLAEKKINDFNLDSSYYVVGSDQDYHFKVLFSVLEKLGIRKDWRHLSYGMVSLPTGRMKSREGTAVFADDLIEETIKIARDGIIERAEKKLAKKEMENRSTKIALSAIKYSLLKVDIKRGIVFDPKEALSFEGDTGPYLLYSYARANSILKRLNKKISGLDMPNPNEYEVKLIKKISDFPSITRKSYENLAPNVIANYSFELSKIFNEFYHACPVIGSREESFRLKLVDAFKITLKKSLDLLAIDVLEEM